MTVILHVLLVEDEPDDLAQLEQRLPALFGELGNEVSLTAISSFEDAHLLATNSLYRFDMIISDTYRGNTRDRDAAVLEMIRRYRGHRFCPMVVYSSGVKPPEIEETAFVEWADKGQPRAIDEAVARVLATGVAQTARKLHDELESSAAGFLWGFLEREWNRLNSPTPLSPALVERLLRRRAALQLGDLDAQRENTGILNRDASEYYVYPALAHEFYSLGDVVRSKKDGSDWRVILTPHCYLFPQGDKPPRADHVVVAPLISSAEVLQAKDIAACAGKTPEQQDPILRQWARSPSDTPGRPQGRHWYFPGFLDIPHSFCDFLRISNIEQNELRENFSTVATLVPPYAEALQACFVRFFGTVGIPGTNPESIRSILQQ